MTQTAIDRLRAANFTLPAPPQPLGAYAPATEANNLLYLSGMLPLRGGAPVLTGRLGAELEPCQGFAAAQLAVLNALAVVHAQVGLARVDRVVRLAVHLACVNDFHQHAAVADGASEVLNTAFAPTMHSRLVFGSVALPAGVPVELDLIFALHPGGG